MSSDSPSGRQRKRPSAIQLGLHAARSNLRPGLVLWVFAIAIVAGYWFAPPFRDFLNQIAHVKERFGIFFSAVSTAIFGGVLPLLFRLLKPNRSPLRYGEVRFGAGFWAYKGVEVDLLYRFQAWLWGNNTHLTTILEKVFVDQFVYVPLIAVPTMVVGYRWLDCRFSWGECRRQLHWTGFRDQATTVMLANWGVWIPTVAIIYCLPLPLQLPLQNLALCLWVLMLLFLTNPKEQADSMAAPASRT